MLRNYNSKEIFFFGKIIFDLKILKGSFKMSAENFNIENLREKLFELQDLNYKNFQSKLIPTVAKEKIVGVRTPELRKLTKNFFQKSDAEIFLNDLPHKFFEENYIHDFLLIEMKNFETCLCGVKNFLPYIDNWAICDSLVPKIFSQNSEKLFFEIEFWIASEKIYTVRFGILMLMKFYLGKNFDKKYLRLVSEIKNKNYYVETMSAWYFAESLVKQYDSAIIFLEKNLLSPNVRKKTIQKAVESLRISEETKKYLRSLK